MASDFGLREVEAKFALPHTPPSQFTLPPTLFPQSAMHSSSSLPASPSRPHPGFAAAPFKYFPVGFRSVEALAPEVARKRENEEDHAPQPKRNRSGDEEIDKIRSEQSVIKPLHPMSLSSITGSTFSQPTPTGVQFYPIPMINQSTIATFLPQGFIGTGGPPNQPSPTADQNEQRPPTSHGEG